MGRIFVAGLVIVMVGAFMVIGLASEAPNALAGVIPTDTPTPTASDTPTPSATATPTTTASASVSASASVAASASAVQPAAVPLTGGNPSDGSPNLALILAIALGAVAGTGGVLAASYGLTRRS
jgi:hypothetical protein